MIRRQVYLPKVLYHRIQLRAARENVSVADVVRHLLEAGFRHEQRTSAGEGLLRLSKICGSGPADLSERLDDYLYGDAD